MNHDIVRCIRWSQCILLVAGLSLPAQIFLIWPHSPAFAESHHLYLPFLTIHRTAPSTTELNIEETAFLSRPTEALAAQGNHVYLGAGNVIVTYDVSEPGNARRRGESEPVEGRIFRVEAGDGVLFVLSRPDFDMEEFQAENPGWGGELDELPPWNLLTVFDITNPSAPSISAGIEFEHPMLYAVDAIARGQHAYILLSPTTDREDLFHQVQRTGLWIINANIPEFPTVTEWIPADDFLAHRMTMNAGRLDLISGRIPEAFVPRPRRFNSGTMSFRLDTPNEPSFIGAAGDFEFDGLTMPHSIASTENRVYRISASGEGYLLTTEFQSDGPPRLIGIEEADERGVEPRDIMPSLRQLGITSDAWHTAAAPNDQLIILETELQTTRISVLDMKLPLEPKVLSQVELEGIELWRFGGLWPDRLEISGDIHNDMVRLDDRIFLAASGHAALLEIRMVDTGGLVLETGYAELGGGGCASTAGTHLYHLRPETHSLTIRNMNQPKTLPEIASIRIPMGQGCAVEMNGTLLFVSEAGGVGIFDVSDSTKPTRHSHLPMDGVIRDFLIRDQTVLVTTEDEGLSIFDVSDPSSPQRLSRLDTPGQASALAIYQSKLYLADGDAGIALIDIDDPREPEIRHTLALGGEALSLTASRERLYVGLRHSEDSRGRPWLPELITIQPGESPEVVHRLVLDPWSWQAAIALDPETERLFISSGFGIQSLDVSGKIPVDLGHAQTGDGPEQLVFGVGTLIGLEWDGIRVLRID